MLAELLFSDNLEPRTMPPDQPTNSACNSGQMFQGGRVPRDQMARWHERGRCGRNGGMFRAFSVSQNSASVCKATSKVVQKVTTRTNSHPGKRAHQQVLHSLDFSSSTYHQSSHSAQRNLHRICIVLLTYICKFDLWFGWVVTEEAGGSIKI